MGWQGGNGFRGYRYPPHANGTPETAASELGGGVAYPPESMPPCHHPPCWTLSVGCQPPAEEATCYQ